MSLERPQPQNLDAEEHVLGAIMLAGTAQAGSTVVAKIRERGLVAEDFYRQSHGLIFAAALALEERGEPTDVLALEHELGGRLADAGGKGRLVELAGLVPAIANAAHYAKLVVDAAVRREQASVGLALWHAAENGAVDDALRERVRRLLEPRNTGERSGGHTWRALDVTDLGSDEPQAPDIGGLLYRGKRHLVSGEDDAGKTMLLLGIAADELQAERGVVWIDTDDMGPSMILERLRAFGTEDDAIRDLFAYMRPEEALADSARDDLLALIADLDARLIVTDAFNSSLTLHGYSPKDTEDVEAFLQGVIAPFCRAGVGAVLLDHVVKDREARGRYAYGSERKSTGCDLHLGLRVVEPFGRGKRGKARITVHRDRIGFLEKPSPGSFVLDSDPETGRLAWTIEASHDRGDKGEWRPTGYMEKVSDYLGRFGSPASRKQVETDVTGKAEHIRTAIDVLVAEGFAAESSGERGARMVEHVKPLP